MKACLPFLDLFIIITGNQNSISSILFEKDKISDYYLKNSEVEKAKKQLDEYLNGQRTEFCLNLDINTTAFAHEVLTNMQKVAYGKTLSYKELGALFQSEHKSRAIGNACHHNNHVIVIPCHRIIKNDGSLGGFAPGIKYKEYLLDLEKKGGEENG